MANRLLGEYRCEFISETMDSAVAACIAAAPGLKEGSHDAVEGLMNGLVLSGIAMQMMGDSRPASGAEHHVAHFLEMRDLQRGRRGTLHGDKVGMAALLVMRMYEKFFEAPLFLKAESREDWEKGLRKAFGALSERIISESNPVYFDTEFRQKALDGIKAHWDYFKAEAAKLPALRLSGEANIKSAGGPVRPEELGYTRQDIVDALNYAKEVRDKFTILRMAWLSGRLAQLAEEIADEFC